MKEWNYDNIWYHGSPEELTYIRKGSTITQDRRLAEVFSHKPAMVSIGGDGTITHNGSMPGYLYNIAERISPDDVIPHPRTSMAQDKEWLTNRDLQVTLVCCVPLTKEELLTEEEIMELQERLSVK